MSKLPHIGSSIFTVMSQMATEHNAINLSQGFPNFPVDDQLIEIIKSKVDENIHQYAPMGGNPKLLGELSRLTLEQYGRSVHPSEEILVTAGATQAIFTAIQALVNKGEEVVILDPSYDCYEPPIVLTGGVPVHVQMAEDFLPDWQKIREAVNKNTKMMIINNPHNPTGKTWTSADFDQLEKLVDSFSNLIVFSDEVYEYITFEQPHISIHNRQKLWNRSITVSSFGKSFHITGWKIGYVIAPEHLMKEIKKVHQFLVFSVNSISQVAISEYLDIVDVYSLGNFYQQKRDFFRNLLKETKLQLLPCEGTYFQVASYANISSEDDFTFTKRLVTEFGVAAIPISPFYADRRDTKCIRFCFAKDDATLIQAAERLIKL